MPRFKLSILTFLAVLSANGCTMTMKEDMIFNPPVGMPADSVADMTMDDVEMLTAPDSAWIKEDRFAGLLPATVVHGYFRPDTREGAYTIIRAQQAADGAQRPLIVSCYGTGADRPNHGVYYAEKLLAWGDVIQFDYPGYGDSVGKPSIAGIADIGRDVVAMADGLASDRPLIFWGHSLGGFICPRLAEQSAEADAVVYENSALSAEEAGKEWKPWFMRLLPITMKPEAAIEGDNNIAALKDFQGPVLVIAGGRDKVLPAWLSRSIFTALEEQGNDATYLELPDATHINAPLQPEFAGLAAPVLDRIPDLQSK